MVKDLVPQAASQTVSERTRAALAQAKARGVVLGSAGTRNLQATLEKRQVK